jgi:hypothetical protein
MASIWRFISEARPYILQILLGSLALFGLLKDWKDYGNAAGRFKKPVRIVVLVGTLTIVVLSIFETYDARHPPKARLAASFWYPNINLDNLQHEVTVSKNPDGSIALDVAVLNPGDVAALNGSFTIRICQGCNFSKEPNGSIHICRVERTGQTVAIRPHPSEVFCSEIYD